MDTNRKTSLLVTIALMFAIYHVSLAKVHQPQMGQQRLTAKDIQRIRSRLIAYVNVVRDWTADAVELTNEQQQQINAVCQKNITSGLQRIERKAFRWRIGTPRPGRYYAIGPVTFTRPSGAGDRLNLVRFGQPISQLRSVLTPTQSERLTAACAKRSQFLRRGMVSQVINILDAELFMTMRQRESLRLSLPELLSGMEGRSVCLFPSSDYLQQQPLAPLILEPALLEVLTESQAKIAQDLGTIGSKVEARITPEKLRCHSREGIDAWKARLKKLKMQFTKQLGDACAVRVSYLTETFHLPSESTRRLTVAARGATLQVVETWADSATTEIHRSEKRLRELQGNFVFVFLFPAPDSSSLDRNPVWQKTVADLVQAAENPIDPRHRARRLDDAATIVSLLDRELWLRQSQREPLEKLIYDVLPESGLPPRLHAPLNDLSMLLVPLRSLKASELELLTTDQKNAWKRLVALFEFEEGRAYVTDAFQSRPPIEVFR